MKTISQLTRVLFMGSQLLLCLIPVVRSPSSGGLSSSLLSPSPASSPVSQTYRPPQTSSTASSPLSQTYKSVSESPSSHISPHTLSYIQSRKQRLHNQEAPTDVTDVDDTLRPAIKKPLRGLGENLYLYKICSFTQVYFQFIFFL